MKLWLISASVRLENKRNIELKTSIKIQHESAMIRPTYFVHICLQYKVCGRTSFFLIRCECTAASSSLSLCKLFDNKVRVNLDGIPSTNPLLATPNIWCRNLGEGEGDLPIEVQIGGEYYWRIIKDVSTIHLSSSLVLLPTKFSWILTGNIKRNTANEMMVNHITLEHSDNDLRRFWDLETFGITPSQEKPMTTGDSQILQEFRDSYRIEDGSRFIRLPTKNNCELSPNRDTAQRRFRALHK